MNRGAIRRWRLALWGGTALLSMGAPAAVMAQTVQESNRYPVRLMLETFDGNREFSHTQIAGIARMRQGDESWVEVDFGNGAVLIEGDDSTQAQRFRNTSGVEQGMRYDYATSTLRGDPRIADFHNLYVRPLLGKGPALGSDVSWTRQLTLGDVGFATLRGAPFTIEFERRYFTHEGKRYALLHYQIPSFTYTADGRAVAFWGEGIAVTDPTFGEMYWNAALHRAVASEGNAESRPYRYTKTIAALDSAGKPLIDPNTIPEVADFVDRFYGTSAKQVIPFSEGASDGAGMPLEVAAKLDILALSVAENSANQLGELTGAYTQAAHGSEELEPYIDPRANAAADELGASQTANGGTSSPPETPPLETAAHEVADVLQGQGPATPVPPPPPSPNDSGGGEVQAGTTRGGDGGGGAAGGGTGNGGGGGGGSAAAYEAAYTTSDTLNTGVDTGDKLAAIAEGISSLQADMAAAVGDLKAATATYQDAKAALEAMPMPMKLSEEARALQKLYESQKAEIATFQAVFENIDDLDIKAAPGMVEAYRTLSSEMNATFGKLQPLLVSGAAYVPDPGPLQLQAAQRLKDTTAAMAVAESRMISVYNQAGRLQGAVKALGESDFGKLVARFGDSPAGKILGNVATGLNVMGTVGAIANLKQLQTDLSQGQDLNLTRSYGTAGSVGTLMFELAALTGNVLSGNVKGAILDSVNIATGSITDIIIAGAALHATNRLERETAIAAYTNELALIDKRLDQFEATIAGYQTDIEQAKEDIEDIKNDEAAQKARDLLAEHQRNREEQARLAQEAEAAAEAERQQLVQEARADNERRYQESLKRPPTPEEWAQFNADIAEAMKPDYPTAPPPTPEQLAARLQAAEDKRQAQLDSIAQQAAEAAAAALADAEAKAQKERELAQAQSDAVEKREQEAADREAWLQEARDRELEVSSLDTEPVEFEPVVFDPPVWDPPVFDPPVWVPPEFDPPEASEIPWTDFGDDDWLGDTGNLAYGYEGMSGTIETDLSRWAEWLATQDIRKLERLALQAGYPNLASALADAANIIRLSQDDGYRQWALTAPSCGGYVGCGPSYLERWNMKLSIVALGDILAASRDIFSSGGFSDIGISSRDLSYLLRDHGLEDGDIVRIRIQQFGQTIYEGTETLTNAGADFTQLLHPGVASLEIYAVNEGFAIPNTAQITVDNVVRGEATQTYELSTGETATLRIENNVK